MRNYRVQPEYIQDRTGNEEKRDAISAKWSAGGEINGTNGNLCGELKMDTDGDIFFASYSEDKKGDGLYRMIPSSLLMYRLVCTFFVPPVCGNNYKSVWDYPLTHKETGELLIFGDSKGGAAFWTRFYSHADLSKGYKADLLEMLEYLLSDECAHPYDNLVAGSVA